MPRPRSVPDEDILAAAAKAVGEVGPSHLTLAELGSRVGLSPATLVQRFGSKRGLLLALATHDADAVPRRIRTAADEDDPIDALVEVMTGFASSVGSASDFANHLSFLLMDLSDPDFQQISRRHATSVQQAIEEVLATAVARGGVTLRLPADEVARLVYAMYNGALVTWGMRPRGAASSTVAAALTALVTALSD